MELMHAIVCNDGEACTLSVISSNQLVNIIPKCICYELYSRGILSKINIGLQYHGKSFFALLLRRQLDIVILVMHFLCCKGEAARKNPHIPAYWLNFVGKVSSLRRHKLNVIISVFPFSFFFA